MRKIILKYPIGLALIIALIFVTSCSSKKNTRISRTYHNLTGYYNVYYNGKEAYKNGMKKIDASHNENYSVMIPLFKYSNKATARAAYGDMNRAIEKGSKCILKHSITVKPEIKAGKKQSDKQKAFRQKNEYVKWIDDSYILVGKANFIKGDYYPAIETFNFIIREYADVAVKYEAYLWLARTYTEMGKFDKANDFISKLEADKQQVPESLAGPVAITRADVFIKQHLLSQAIPALNDGIQHTKNKKEKVRYLYLLAQIHQELGENKKAYDVYGQVIDFNPDYQMIFNARINRASIFNSKAGDSKDLQKQLAKMLKDDKNIDFQDQIYYALGNIALGELREDDAIEFFKLSAKKSTKNNYQKSLSYLAIANLYFDKPIYPEAQVYYDSAVSYLDKEHPNFTEIKLKSQNLNALVYNLNTIYTQDSLQKMALMPELNRNRIIDSIISELVEQERIEKELEAQRQAFGRTNSQTGEATTQSGGQWYFYNPSMIGQGQATFRKQWGDRKNEDNWRRINKSESGFGDSDDVAEEDANKKQYSNKSREYYLVDLPLTDSAMQASDAKIEKAYFNLATIYSEKFMDFGMSIKGYTDLLALYPETEYRLSIYYSLFKLHQLNNQSSLAEEYKQMIISEFPESDYAKILINPEYYKELDRIENRVNFVYQATYKYFINENCVEVNNNYHFVDSAFPKSKLISKFALLKTLCEGRKGDSVAFRAELTAFIDKYPKAEEVSYAQEVLYALDRERREVELEKEEERQKEFGGDIAAGSFKDSMDVSMYTFNAAEEHYYLLVVDNTKADDKRLKFNLENFNLDYFYFLSFEVESDLLSASYNTILVKKFKNKKMASNYYESVVIANEVLNEVDSDAYKAYVISKSNLTKFLQDKSIARYHQFFNTHYSDSFSY